MQTLHDGRLRQKESTSKPSCLNFLLSDSDYRNCFCAKNAFLILSLKTIAAIPLCSAQHKDSLLARNTKFCISSPISRSTNTVTEPCPAKHFRVFWEDEPE